MRTLWMIEGRDRSAGSGWDESLVGNDTAANTFGTRRAAAAMIPSLVRAFRDNDNPPTTDDFRVVERVVERAAPTPTTTIVFSNHPPIRLPVESLADERIKTLWLGSAYMDFGGREFWAYRNRHGEHLVWYEFTTPYDTGHSYNSYIGKFRPGAMDAMESAGMRGWIAAEYPGRELVDGAEDIGRIRIWMESLGLSKVEEF